MVHIVLALLHHVSGTVKRRILNYDTKSIFLALRYRPGTNSCITALIPTSVSMGCRIRPLLQELTMTSSGRDRPSHKAPGPQEYPSIPRDFRIIHCRDAYRYFITCFGLTTRRKTEATRDWLHVPLFYCCGLNS